MFMAVSDPDTAFLHSDEGPMLITLNGEKKEIPEGLTVDGLLRHLEIKPERVAVEIGEEIVRKASYGSVNVKDGDRVEVVQFMGGGSQGRATVPAA
jgi:sulfur carrier protein